MVANTNVEAKNTNISAEMQDANSVSVGVLEALNFLLGFKEATHEKEEEFLKSITFVR